MPSISRFLQEHNQVMISFDDGNTCVFPFVYLRHFDPGKVHENGQRTIEAGDLDLEITPEGIAIASSGSDLTIFWPDGNSSFSADWLLEHRLSSDRNSLNPDASGRPRQVLWGSDISDKLSFFDCSEISSDPNLYTWLTSVLTFGFGLLRNVPIAPGQLRDVIGLFGYPRETNYGVIFNVREEQKPNNLAYTSLRISPHTDNPYRHPVPTLQVLHCLNDSCDGGDTILVDGFRIAHELREIHPEYFSILSRAPVRFRFKDKLHWLEFVGPIIQLDAVGEVQTVRFNSRSLQPLQMSHDAVIAFYQAYIFMAKMVEDEKYCIRFHLNPGDLYVVENERVLHGRSAFTAKGGDRWLQGAYADVDGMLSTWRVLRHRISNLSSL